MLISIVRMQRNMNEYNITTTYLRKPAETINLFAGALNQTYWCYTPAGV